jgi:hypothetical protein
MRLRQIDLLIFFLYLTLLAFALVLPLKNCNYRSKIEQRKDLKKDKLQQLKVKLFLSYKFNKIKYKIT